MPNRISKHQVLAQLCFVTSGGTWVKARGFRDRNAFTQRLVRQATYVRQATVVTVSNEQIYQIVSRITPHSLRTQISVATLGWELMNMAQWCNGFHKENRSLLHLPGDELPSWKFWPSQKPLSIYPDPGRRLSSFVSSIGKCPVWCYPPILFCDQLH